eukprot:m.239882 g.239882  ORF g.239882 m.239882 type:complete len:312 (-) comp14157_c0_seq1:107-1042(-)
MFAALGNSLLYLIKKIFTLSFLLVKLPFHMVGRVVSLFYWPRKDVSQETVLITGAASGIGKLMANEFASLGSRVVIWDLKQEVVDSVVDEMREVYGNEKIFGYAVDVTDRQLVYDTADKMRAEIGNVTMLVNNAGIVNGKTLLESDDDKMVAVMNVNSIAHFWTTKAFLPYMLEHNHGHIVTIASSAGLFGIAGLTDYCASKFAAVGFDEALRLEMRKLKKDGVYTTCVCPFLINTGMFDGTKSEILPILNPKRVVNRIMKCVLTNQSVMRIPQFLYLTDVFKAFVPPALFDELVEWFGTDKVMDEFRGRH